MENSKVKSFSSPPKPIRSFNQYAKMHPENKGQAKKFTEGETDTVKKKTVTEKEVNQYVPVFHSHGHSQQKVGYGTEVLILLSLFTVVLIFLWRKSLFLNNKTKNKG